MNEVKAKKFLGQHFLTDESIAQRIVESLTGRTSNLLEIGPGMGVLTKYLILKPELNFHVVEIDRESVAWLHEHYPTLKVIEGDFLKLDLSALFHDTFAVIGNFPYNISSQILFRVFECRNEVSEVVGAERIRKAEVYLTGQTADRYLWDGRTSNRTCAIGFETEIDVTEGRLFAVFNSFGRSLQTETDVIVNVLVTTENGSRCRYVYDVTDQWLNPDNAAHRIVVEEPVEIPGDDYQGGGFDPIVNDWDGEAIPIIIE